MSDLFHSLSMYALENGGTASAASTTFTRLESALKGYDPERMPLSLREVEVLQQICQELTSIEIGEKLCLSPRTVETYRRTMMEKVGARNTVGLVLWAIRNGVILP